MSEQKDNSLSLTVASTLLAAAIGGLCAASLCGCYVNECAFGLECGRTPGTRCQEDIVLELRPDHPGVFVSSSRGDDQNPGTMDHPVRTFEKALWLAAAGPGRIFACAEDFEESVIVYANVEVWGGFDCHNGWRDVHGAQRTRIRGGPDLVPMMLGKGRKINVVLADMTLEAADATVPSGSSIAMLAGSGAEVEVCRSELIAGRGADGAPGAQADVATAPAGRQGHVGQPACAKPEMDGGRAAVSVCADEQSIGGAGGTGYILGGGSGYDGIPLPVSNPMGYGVGGSGQNDDHPTCLEGLNGIAGTNGIDGVAGRGAATITPAGWRGVAGEDGGDGRPGQGGSGGGGSRGGTPFCDPGMGGASGGSGGAGGCGGKGGKGGGHGGASIGLVIYDGAVTALEGVSIRTARGGDGGRGGQGQRGGYGGAGAPGGAGVNDSQPGCAGGWGGKGGNGGHGAGGEGGFSLGVAYLGNSLHASRPIAYQLGKPGEGGRGGSEQPGAGDGIAGKANETMPFPRLPE